MLLSRPRNAMRLLAVQLFLVDLFLTSVIDGFSPNGLVRFRSSPLRPLPAVAVLSDLTVSQANDLATPFLMASAIPGIAFCYLLNKVPDCPKGVVFGITWVMLLGATAYPTELYTQSAYGVSFFDCDWVHGPISFFFAMGYFAANLSFVNALGRNTTVTDITDKQNYEHALADFSSYARPVLLTSMAVLAIAAVQSTKDPQVHTPWLFNNDLNLLTQLNGQEPANALTVELWASHISELTQYQMIMTMMLRWSRQNGNSYWKNIAWGLFPLQVGNVAIVGFHFLYNQAPAMLLSFGVLTFLGYSTAALAVFQLLESSKHESSEAVPIMATESRTMATESTKMFMSELETDSPGLNYGLKWTVFCILASYGVKYGSLAIDLPGNLDIGIELAMIMLPSISGLLLLHLLSLDSKLRSGNQELST